MVFTMLFLQFLCYLLRTADIPLLAGLVAATHQNDDPRPALDEIKPIAWAMIDAKFADPVKEFHVSKETAFNDGNPLSYPTLSPFIAESIEPIAENDGLTDFDHL
jgi:hypothetical protein